MIVYYFGLCQSLPLGFFKDGHSLQLPSNTVDIAISNAALSGVLQRALVRWGFHEGRRLVVGLRFEFAPARP
jgi:hypothetical protein